MAKIEREEIVGRAIDLMLTGGYDGTSMAQISQACGIRKASLYHHFPEKDALVLAAIGQIHAHFREHIFAIAWREDIDADQRLRKLGQATFAFFRDRRGGCLLGNFALALSERAPHFQAPLRTFFDDWVAALAHVFKGQHGAARARTLAFDVVAQIQGAIMMMRLYQNPQHLRRAIASTH